MPNDNTSGKEPTTTQSNSEEVDVQPVEVKNAIRKLAENKPNELMEFMAMEMSSNINPLHNKMNQEHISQVLDLASKHDERQYDLHKISIANEFDNGKSNRLYGLFFAILGIALIITILILFRDKPEILFSVLSGLGGLASGFAGGWGFAKK